MSYPEKKYILLLAALLLLSCAPHNIIAPVPGTPGAPGDEEQPYPAYIEDEIVVKLRAELPLSVLDALIPGVRKKDFPGPGATRYAVYRLFDAKTADTVLAALNAGGLGLQAEKNAVYTLCAFTPDDAFYGAYQWAPQTTQCDSAWDIEQGYSNPVVVAVIDTGINGEHEDLAGRVIAGRDIIAGTDIAPSTNSDWHNHGTHVAGIIGARGNNGIGIAGVSWNVQLMPVKVFSDNTATTMIHITEGIIWAVDHGADIISMSLVGEVFSMAVNDAVQYAYASGVVVIAAMGNDSRYKIAYPAALPGVIAVGATTGKDELAFFSSRGTHISVAAPGQSIYSSVATGNSDYKFYSGTSMATPFVSGLAALLLAYNPVLSPDEVRSLIEDSADPLGGTDFNPLYGHGRVNAYQALALAPRDNYSSVTVDVTNQAQAVGGIKVLLEDAATSAIVQSGVTSYGSLDPLMNGRIIFNQVRAGAYRVRAYVGAAQSADVTVAGDEAVALAFDTPMVLIVNGIKDVDFSMLTDEYLYTQKLNALGKYYAVWTCAYFGPPTESLMNSYDLVMWYTGKTKNNTEQNIEVLSAEEITAITNYLTGGGRLFLCGNNIAEHLSTAAPLFLSNILHAGYTAPQLPHDELFGAGFLDGMTQILYLEDDDQITPLAGATGILDANGTAEIAEWAGLSWETGYRLVFTTVCPNEILYCNPDTFLESIIEWLELN